MKHCTSRRGFSLIELMVVMALIGALVGLGFPFILAYMEDMKLQGSARRVATEMAKARRKAISMNANRGVLFVPGYPSDNQFQFLAEDDPANTAAIPVVPIPPVDGAPNGAPQTLPNGINFVPLGGGPSSWGGKAIRFDRLGGMCVVGATGCPVPNGSVGGDKFVDYSASPTEIRLVNNKTGRMLTIFIRLGGSTRIEWSSTP